MTPEDQLRRELSEQHRLNGESAVVRSQRGHYPTNEERERMHAERIDRVHKAITPRLVDSVVDYDLTQNLISGVWQGDPGDETDAE